MLLKNSFLHLERKKERVTNLPRFCHLNSLKNTRLFFPEVVQTPVKFQQHCVNFVQMQAENIF